MITHCPYCRQENEGVKHWHKESDGSKFRAPVAQEASTPEPPSWDTVEMVMILPCEHSFRIEDMREINEMLRERHQIEEELEQETSSFERKIISEKLEGASIKLDALIDKANANMERTPPEGLRYDGYE